MSVMLDVCDARSNNRTECLLFYSYGATVGVECPALTGEPTGAEPHKTKPDLIH